MNESSNKEINESGEVKGVALNLKRSPENCVFWECADPFIWGVGDAVYARMTSVNRHPGVEDSIEPDNDRRVTRRVTKRLLGNRPQWKCPSTSSNVKRGRGTAALRVMGGGVPQRPSDETANPRGVKPPHG